MLALDAELRKIVDAFDHARVGYAIAGGVAVSIYTLPRATEDLDVFIARPSRERARAVLGNPRVSCPRVARQPRRAGAWRSIASSSWMGTTSSPST
jgi:hypothetical protein